MTTRLTRTLTGQRGFTLAEVLVAVVIIMVGLVAVASGFQYATSGVATGRGETIAIFLAEQRVEQLKTVAMTNYDPPYPGLSLATGTTTTEFCSGSTCQATAITGTTSYTRVTTITDITTDAGRCTGVTPLLCKRIRVTVTYRPVTSRGDVSQARTVDLFAIVTPRS
jgi:prepilin-type N-terminal cleavage/methylation domain-containing protein